MERNNIDYAKIWTMQLERYELHDHNGFEITLILSGKLRQMCNGVTTMLKEGDITFLSPNCIHQYISTGEPAEIINLTFPRQFVSDDVWKYADMTKMPLVIHLEGDVLSACRETLFSVLALSKAPMEPLPENTYLKNMIEWLVLKLFARANDSMAVEDSFSPAIIYIHSHFTQQLTEQEVADLLHYTPTYFSMLFKKKFGITFKTYLVNLRLDYAAELLETTSLTISSVCEKCGFITPVYFSRAFKKKFGITPGEYKNKQQRKDCF